MAESTKELVPDTVRIAEGEALRKLIEESEFNQQTLASTSGVGSKGFLWQVVSGRRPLNLEVATRLAKTLKVRIDVFSPRLADVVREAATLVLPASYLRERNGDSVANAPIPISRAAEASGPRSQWPFTQLTPAEWAAISPGSRAEVESIVKGMAIEASKRGNIQGA